MKIRKMIIGTELLIAIDYKGITSIIRCGISEENIALEKSEKKLRGEI